MYADTYGILDEIRYRVLVGVSKNERVPGVSSGFLYSWYRAGGRPGKTARGLKVYHITFYYIFMVFTVFSEGPR